MNLLFFDGDNICQPLSVRRKEGVLWSERMNRKEQGRREERQTRLGKRDKKRKKEEKRRKEEEEEEENKWWRRKGRKGEER